MQKYIKQWNTVIQYSFSSEMSSRQSCNGIALTSNYDK